MAKKLFITGTGTDIGKTYVTGLILKKLQESGRRAAYYKAAMSGNERDEEGHLIKINERTHIEKHDGGTAYTEDDGKTWTMLPKGSIVSMNMWGFTNSIMKEIGSRFPKFLEENLPKNPLKCEFFLPSVVGELLAEEKATVEVLKSEDKWYGVTYKEDKPVVVAAIQKLKDEGRYPQKLWEEA